jgi:hypothetical protein
MSRLRPFFVVLLALLSFVLLTAQARRRSARPAQLVLDARRSLLVTDLTILDAFSFERVMTALASSSGTTPKQLYQQWFDTQNPAPGLGALLSPHCDDVMVDGKPGFNGFPRRCPTPEGALAASDPFAAGDYVPIAIANRFDLAPASGADCGEYRIVFAKKNKASPLDLLHISFEGSLPNPTPQAGLAGCRPIAQFWADLTNVDSAAERRARLEKFFFEGIDGFAPVMRASHFNAASGGGMRTIQRTMPNPTARFYQFRIENGRVVPDLLRNLAAAKLFDGNSNSAAALRFQDDFIQQIPTLIGDDINKLAMNTPREFLMVESDPDENQQYNWERPFIIAALTDSGRGFSDRISNELKRLGSALTPREVVIRSQATTCTGCHALNGAALGGGLTFPYSVNALQHIDEELTEVAGGGRRYLVSEALSDVFLPHREAILRNFLTTGAAP